MVLLAVVLLPGALPLAAAELKGIVTDPTGQPVPGAQVALVNPTGVITTQITDDTGAFDIYVSPLYENVQLRVTARGFQTITVGMGAARIQLKLAAAPASRQGSSVGTITSAELRDRNEAQVVDLIRETPGVLLNQSGPRGSPTDLMIRGADSRNTLVLLDGIPVNSFYGGGLFDFAQIPSDLIEEVDITRGPQSAVYGSYAAGGAVNLVTRAPENGAAFDALAEGGSHDENRVSLGGSGMIVRDWGIAGSLSELEGNGDTHNANYRNDSIFLATSYRWLTQNLFAFGSFDSNKAGESSLSPFSRDKNNVSTYGLHWQDGITDNLRADLFAGFFLDNSLYLSPVLPGFNAPGFHAPGFNKDIRAYAEGRITYSFSNHWILAGGYSFSREETRDGYLTDTSGRDFLLRRDNDGIYLETRINFGKFYITAGLREDIYQTPLVPADAAVVPPRPVFPTRLDDKLNPKIAGAYTIDPTTNLHASFATGIRPPGGAELAATNNPALLPERTESYDVGLTKRLLSDRLSVDATWFHNRYKDLIVAPGDALVGIYPYSTGNLANAKAEGVDASARLRLTTWFSATGNYMWLESEALSLDGGPGLIQQYFYLGQPLLRRPKHSGSLVATFHYKRLDMNLLGYFRTRTLDVGLQVDHSYENVGVNVNFRVKGNITLYGDLRNALDQRYEEVYGFPAPLLNFVAGVKWNLARAR